MKERAIIRLESVNNHPNFIMFFPDTPANPGRISYYSGEGYHGEADLEYYLRHTHKPSKDDARRATAFAGKYEDYARRLPDCEDYNLRLVSRR